MLKSDNFDLILTMIILHKRGHYASNKCGYSITHYIQTGFARGQRPHSLVANLTTGSCGILLFRTNCWTSFGHALNTVWSLEEIIRSHSTHNVSTCCWSDLQSHFSLIPSTYDNIQFHLHFCFYIKQLIISSGWINSCSVIFSLLENLNEYFCAFEFVTCVFTRWMKANSLTCTTSTKCTSYSENSRVGGAIVCLNECDVCYHLIKNISEIIPNIWKFFLEWIMRPRSELMILWKLFIWVEYFRWIESIYSNVRAAFAGVVCFDPRKAVSLDNGWVWILCLNSITQLNEHWKQWKVFAWTDQEEYKTESHDGG